MTARVEDDHSSGPITVEQAYRARLKAAGEPVPAPRAEEPPPPVAPPAPRPAPPPPHLRARPRIEPEQGILGLSRHTRSRLGSRLFNLFFVCVFALIVVQMVVALLSP